MGGHLEEEVAAAVESLCIHPLFLIQGNSGLKHLRCNARDHW